MELNGNGRAPPQFELACRQPVNVVLVRALQAHTHAAADTLGVSFLSFCEKTGESRSGTGGFLCLPHVSHVSHISSLVERAECGCCEADLGWTHVLLGKTAGIVVQKMTSSAPQLLFAVSQGWY